MAEKRASGADFAQLDELDDDLLVEIDELVVGQLECLDGLEDRVPVAARYLAREAIDRVNCVQAHTCLVLFALCCSPKFC